jgi:hypothetical protein
LAACGTEVSRPQLRFVKCAMVRDGERRKKPDCYHGKNLTCESILTPPDNRSIWSIRIALESGLDDRLPVCAHTGAETWTKASQQRRSRLVDIGCLRKNNCSWQRRYEYHRFNLLCGNCMSVYSYACYEKCCMLTV